MAANVSGGQVMFSKKDTRDSLEYAQDRTREAGSGLCCGMNNATHQACSYVRSNPWAGVGAGAVVGFIVGMLISRK
ncbi:DUF883 domain-containing protein [Mixta calida]|uniref:DUF883 domain-containing protein n=2 Tax=Mixta calida TaxID=665913 RepID=A0ABN5HG79_9GAMM|nr:DUF883 domain-containing protein [Mixta calida]POU43143.1 DUF883 domain-containing protein [Pantoea sp. PSNIH5]POU61474.1 DUF883 domain-containing protein [Pantoea sp. PSNIH4]POY66288.1 DUF883 domain-containing protein [Pantoea sp. PSNIH3]